MPELEGRSDPVGMDQSATKRPELERARSSLRTVRELGERPGLDLSELRFHLLERTRRGRPDRLDAAGSGATVGALISDAPRLCFGDMQHRALRRASSVAAERSPDSGPGILLLIALAFVRRRPGRP